MDHLDQLEIDTIYSYSYLNRNNSNNSNNTNNTNNSNNSNNILLNYPCFLIKVIIFLIIFLIIFVLLAIGFLGSFCQTTIDSCFEKNTKNTSNLIFS
jgi:large-conductance mechanosensitive channel